MNLSIIFYIVGYALKIEGYLMILPGLVGLYYREREAYAFLIFAALTLLLGLLITQRKPKNQDFYAKEGFASVALCWIAISLFGCFPLMLNGDIPRFVDAFFETVSGFTTTSSTVLADIESLSHASLFWRSFSNWLGGMGVLVFILSVLPITGGATMHLMRAEIPGPQTDKVVPKIKNTAKYLYIIYSALTVAEIVILLFCKMPAFDAVTISLGSAGTGGFTVRNSGMADYSAACQYVVGVFMLLFGVNFNVYFLLLRRHLRQALRHEEARWYGLIITLCTLLIFGNTLQMFETASEAFRHAFFQVSSIITTTGFNTLNTLEYPVFSKTVLLVLMFFGACAGSTGGGIKISRIVILVKSMFHEVARLLHPRTVKCVRLERKAVDHGTVRSINTFMIAYALIFLFSTLLVSADGRSFAECFVGVAATINNIGLNIFGEMGNYGGYSDLSKLVFCFDMLAGRLELFPMLILFNPGVWKHTFRRKGKEPKSLVQKTV